MLSGKLLLLLLLLLLFCSSWGEEEAARSSRQRLSEQSLFDHLGSVDEQLLRKFQDNFIRCNREYNSEEVMEARQLRIKVDDDLFFQAQDLSDNNHVLAKMLHDGVLKIHRTGEAYAFLSDGSEEKRLSTDLWYSFSQSAAMSLSSHSSCGVITSSNLVHQTFHLYLFHMIAEKYLWQDSDLIVEFGAGYGCARGVFPPTVAEVPPGLCLLLLSAGFKGRYLIFDLPVFARVQTFYLQAHGHEVRMLPEQLSKFSQGVQGVYIAVNPRDLADALRELEEQAVRSCFIGMWSLAEAPRESRDPLRTLLPLFSSVMLGFHVTWGGIDNDEFVEEARRDFEVLDSNVEPD
ncbi:hypothetical protein GUITHDRAFT_102982 [Guillardia theta CCMP2712]|uniref:Uncharacterized protein n=1 Tax=Guillardia theta (strain CCMP2712) TaxID=905079 RepID=L1JSJ6_GUITC|nr:hypothetical protein GUITHDRAFT_102982 [Guillardia theta CCMP2712]EKX51058.1 hypothetical protein GUITHDRAFT_102982 [Guillardia theta CCMP2712]|eukprot:XP_005838038.1 hypothetical protein GUITHDRAFT_102982 [Guillardia theta CCMP2712]